MRNKIWVFLFSALALTGCVSREQADAKLAKGCQAAAEAFIEENFKIKEVKNKTFSNNATLGNGYRDVTLSVIESDGWYDAEKDYKCIFVEEFGFMGAGHNATIYQFKTPENTYGREGDTIMGEYEDQMKLNDAVDRGMNY